MVHALPESNVQHQAESIYMSLHFAIELKFFLVNDLGILLYKNRTESPS